MLVPMARVELIGPRSLLDEAVSLLHETGLVHIEDLTRRIETGRLAVGHMEVSSRREADRTRLGELLASARSVLEALDVHERAGVAGGAREGSGVAPAGAGTSVAAPKGVVPTAAELLATAGPIIEDARTEVSPVVELISALGVEAALLRRYEPMLRKIRPLASQIATTEGFDSVALLVERRFRTVPEEIRAAVSELTGGQCEIVSAEADEDTTALVVIFPRHYSEIVHRLLESENVSQVRLPSEFGTVPFDTAYRRFQQRQAELPGRIAAANAELAVLKEHWGPQLLAIRDQLADAVDEIDALSRFGSTEYTFVIRGWLPVERLDELRERVTARFGGQVAVYRVAIEDDARADVPIALRNPRFARPFEQLLGPLGGGRPRYGTIDPTIFVAIAYPLIFGIIVGDIGYGAVMLALVLILRARFKSRPSVRLAASVILPATISAILFGFVYGEFFGNVLFTLGLLDPETGRGFIHIFGFRLPYMRSDDIMPLLVVAIGLGVIQIMLGLALGITNAARTGDRKHLLVKSGLLGLVLGMLIVGTAVLFAGREAAPVIRIVGATVMAVGVGLVLRFGAMMGFIETLETVSGMASYIRIMAIGVSGAIFADAVNVLASRVGVIVGILAAVFLHSFHLLIAAFTPTIHALRLNFLEFFGRFYEAGTVEYRPFRKSGGGKHS